ncbi:MAG: hypothetical protein IV298_16080 [Cylindrospermopsis raciborskii KL1]|uniref:hypothetical protein n=1 Tax=Cylindrospermopsis raciborskii TaxID=77022 RepID=UPI001A2F2F64|nr:hypothetical protein [Cylindrospermopsis raciborskii]MBG0744947.1 hypothetical protein [Cylindrospermopsis raciborskii KL1]
MEKGFEKIILQFTTDFENALLFKGVGGDPMLLNTPTEKTPFSPGIFWRVVKVRSHLRDRVDIP